LRQPCQPGLLELNCCCSASRLIEQQAALPATGQDLLAAPRGLCFVCGALVGHDPLVDLAAVFDFVGATPSSSRGPTAPTGPAAHCPM